MATPRKRTRNTRRVSTTAAAATPCPFDIGDTVRLKSGGITMTVARGPLCHDGDCVEVVYSHFETLRRDTLPIATLTPVTTDDIPF
ncbi:DUF2158 domain-containing protein [Microvirga solisilvae]|uniref:DUF2158 domain-containing protein n=1 Tax=Microvirga solisilvae TaxID=2919498 RepID=UPI001FAFE976|nr:DUF2158 domain-containing protein [Microvirga solisilvae]